MASGACGGGGCAQIMGEEPMDPPPAHPRPPHRPPPSDDQDQLADYDFVEEPAKEFFCAVTLELLVEPQQTDCCGHHISADVARRLLVEGKACPMCQQTQFTTHPDKFHGRRIRQLIVRCSNKKSGCGWEGELCDLEAHVGRCPKQPWRCPHCAFVGLQEGGEEHLRGCEQLPMACPNRCEIGHVQRARVQQHLLECSLEIVSCEYAEMGCEVRLPRSEMREHVRESGQDHLLKMCAANLSLSRELSRKVAEKEQQITELHHDMRRREEKMQEQIKENEERMNVFMKEMEERLMNTKTQQTAGVYQEMRRMEKRLNKMVEEGEEKIQKQVKEVAAVIMTKISEGNEEVKENVCQQAEGTKECLQVELAKMENLLNENQSRESSGMSAAGVSIYNNYRCC